MISFDEWFVSRFGMSPEQYKQYLNGFLPYMHYAAERPEAIIECYRKKYMAEIDRSILDTMQLTYEEFLKSYYKLDVNKFHELCDQTGTSKRDEAIALDWFHRRYFEHNEILGLECPF